MTAQRNDSRPARLVDHSADPDDLYVGPDRRAWGQARSPFGAPFIAAGLLLIALWVGVSVLSARGWTLPQWVDARALNALLSSAAAVVILGVAVIFTMRWRLVGETASLRVGAAVGVLGLAVYAVPELGPIVFEEASDVGVVTAVRAAGVLVSTSLLWLAIARPEVDTRVRLRGLLARTAAAVIAGVGLFVVTPSVSGLLGRPGSLPGRDGAAEVVGSVLVGMAWLALAVRYWRTGIRNERWMHTWLGLMLLGLALATLASASVDARSEIWLTGSAALQLVAALLAAYGAAEELRLAWVQQQDRLFRVESEFEIERLRHELEEARRQEQVHDARSALLAIHGAALGLEASAADLDEDERARLARALTAEIGRLQGLVDGGRRDVAKPAPFSVARALSPVLTCFRSTDLGLTAEIPRDLHAMGRVDDLAEVVQNLLDNARRHAPGSPIRVYVAEQGGNAVIRIEDRGPGVEPQEREAIFERGRRGAHGSPAGSGLGLFVSRRLMRDQGGDIWVEGRPGGGASFVLFLPSATRPADTTDESVDDDREFRQVNAWTG